ncbi:MAG: inverse autotransporter beta domain-containing protein [Methylophilales bacterium]|nr:inverse autotransporter beta domain-containing protein [Methylophilales bacterium]
MSLHAEPSDPANKATFSQEQSQFLDLGQMMLAGDVDALTNLAIDSVTEQGVGVTKSFLEKYFPTVELNFGAQGGSKPSGGLLVLAPLSDEKDIFNTYFTQMSAFYQDNRTTLNLGLGYRKLSDDKTLLMGVNAFYDHEFPYDHGRTSLGVEARTTMWEINANKYWATTKWKAGKDGDNEKALGGYDIEAGLPLPYLNWMTLFVRNYRWNAYNGEKDILGNDIKIRARLPMLEGMEVEAGRKFYSSTVYESLNDNYIKISYNVTSLFGQQKTATPWISSEPYKLGSMENRRLEKVRRENIIVKQVEAADFTFSIEGT